MSRSIGFLAVCVVVAIAGLAAAQEAAPPDVSSPIAGLIEQLDSPEFAQRQQATQQLSEMGKAAFEQLERAVAQSSREPSSRALDVLRGHFQRGDNDTKAAAKQALERLAQSGNSAVAQRAQLVLNPPPAPTAQDVAMMMRQAAPVRIANLQIQIAGNALPAGGRSVTTSRNGNGDVKIQVKENGKTTKIESAAGGKIQVEITEPQNGKEVTRAYEVKDLDELKKKDAEVARMYEQYGQPGRVQVGGFLPAGVMLPNRAVPPVPAPQPGEALKRSIDSINAQIERLKAQAPDDLIRKRALDDLKNIRGRFEKQLEQIENPAPAKPPADAAKAAGGQ